MFHDFCTEYGKSAHQTCFAHVHTHTHTHNPHTHSTKQKFGDEYFRYFGFLVGIQCIINASIAKLGEVGGGERGGGREGGKMDSTGCPPSPLLLLSFHLPLLPLLLPSSPFSPLPLSQCVSSETWKCLCSRIVCLVFCHLCTWEPWCLVTVHWRGSPTQHRCVWGGSEKERGGGRREG